MSMYDLAIEIKEEAHRVDKEITRAMDILNRIDYNDDFQELKSGIDEVIEILGDISTDVY